MDQITYFTIHELKLPKETFSNGKSQKGDWGIGELALDSDLNFIEVSFVKNEPVIRFKQGPRGA